MASPAPFPETLSTWQQILAALVPYVGTGGLGAVLIAWLGYRQKKNEPKEEPVKREAMLAVAGAIADRDTIEHLGRIGEKLIDAIERLTDTINSKGNSLQEELRDLRHTADDLRRELKR